MVQQIHNPQSQLHASPVYQIAVYLCTLWSIYSQINQTFGQIIISCQLHSTFLQLYLLKNVLQDIGKWRQYVIKMKNIFKEEKQTRIAYLQSMWMRNKAKRNIRSRIRYQIFNWRIVWQNEPKFPPSHFYSIRISCGTERQKMWSTRSPSWLHWITCLTCPSRGRRNTKLFKWASTECYFIIGL